MSFKRALLATSASFALLCGSAWAQSADTIVVFDGSGSMWGQINGRPKIEIARDTLSTVLSEVPAQTRIGMIAYGHRQKGVCTDIETVVPVAPANQSVPRMIDVANGLKPKGKTPLSDAVRIAAEELKYTENAATVVLVTDGIETCNADPCALATELENAGIGFTAHVVGFGLSEEEGRQVQCLADNTGGLYLSANNADELSNALRKTVQAAEIEPNNSDFGDPISTARNVRFIFRDTEGGEQIGIRQLRGILEKADGTPVEPDAFKLAYPEASGNSAVATLEPGNYVAVLRRDGNGGAGYDVRYAFEIPEGEGEYVIETALSGALTLNVFINPNLQYEKGDPFPTAVGGSRPRLNFAVYPVVNAQKAEEPTATFSEVNGFTLPLSPGQYLIQGNIDSGTSKEQLIEVQAGKPTIIDFSFDATRVFVDARENSGVPVKRQTTFWYDKARSGRNYWLRGGGAGKGEIKPFYLPTGQWLLNVGGEGYGKRRSERLVTVPGDFQDMRIQVGESETLSDADINFLNERGNGCIEILKVRYSGCLTEKADLGGGMTPPPSPDPAPTPPPSPSPQDQTSIPADLNGLSGTAYTFANRDTQVPAYVVFDPNLGDDALMVLPNNWCGTGNCAGVRERMRASRIAKIQSNTNSTGGFYTDNFEIAYTVYSEENKVLYVKPNGQDNIRFDLTNVISLSGSVQDPAPSPTKTSQTAGLEGLSGTDHVFVDDNQEPKIHIVIAPDNASEATIVLEEAWCGFAQCAAERVTTPMQNVDILTGEDFGASAFGANSYSFEISSFGGSKELFVSGAGASRVRFSRLDAINLNGSASEQATVTPVSTGDKASFPFGIFNFDSSGASVDAVTSDFLHTQQCQRRQTVIYPDGYIEVKRFQAPQSANDNPFKTVSAGQCTITGDKYACSVTTPATGEVDTLTFTAQSLGANHYRLDEDGGNVTIAASCFFPGGETQANMDTPVGRPLADLILERSDGNPAGMKYDQNNNISAVQ